MTETERTYKTKPEVIKEAQRIIENGKQPEVIAKAYQYVFENMNEENSLNNETLYEIMEVFLGR